MAQTCSFILDPTDEDVVSQFAPNDLNGDGMWTCPHEPRDGDDVCIFHAPIDETEAEGVSQRIIEQVQRAQEMTAPTDRRRATQFVGARVDQLALGERTLGAVGVTIDFRESSIGEVHFEDAIVASPVTLRGATVSDGITLSGATFEDECDLTAVETAGIEGHRTEFRGRLLFENASVAELRIENATIEQPVRGDELNASTGVSLNQTEFADTVRMGRIEVSGEFDCRDATYRRSVDFSGAMIQTRADFSDTTFDDRLVLSRAFFQGTTKFDDATFGKQLSLDEVTLAGPTSFEGATFTERTTMEATEFAVDISFIDAEFEDRLSFAESSFMGKLTFADAVVQDQAWFELVDFAEATDFEDATFEDELSFRKSRFMGQLTFTDAVVQGQASFEGVHFRGETDFEDAVFEASLDFSNIRTDGDDRINLQGVHIAGGTIKLPEAADVVLDLEEATLGSVSIGAGTAERPLDSYRLVNVTYDGFDFGSEQHRMVFGASDWVLHATHQNAYSATGGWRALLREPRRLLAPSKGGIRSATLEATYLKAKNGANDVGDSVAASKFFQREKRFRRYKHYEALTDPDGSVLDRLDAALNWGSNIGFSLVSGYGERPLRVVLSSLGLIGVFAAIYLSQLGTALDLGGVFDSLLFSFQSFIAFIIGSPITRATFQLRFVSSIQSFIGAFFVALFVFTLTKSIDR